ncbi:uncharacterized protein LOC127060973 [Serinus canaria]|uniref:uncharacterized protein LOC127060973 n=1 Tax=Serinus canaria TaxID=9135 RepID=UPI0021CC4EB3|nr:uncharacterized protein LOC127060973 [Serinus canaria]
MLFEFIMSIGVKACMHFWSLRFFEILIPLWSLGLFSYPEIALVLSLICSFYSRGAVTRIAILLGLVVIACKKFINVLGSAPGVNGSWLCLCIQLVRGRAGGEAFQPLLSFFSSESVASLLENVQFPLNVKETIFLVLNLVSLLYIACCISRMRAEISRRADEIPDSGIDPGVENPKWCGKWENMGQILKEFSDPIVWDFPHEQIQNQVEVGRYLKEKYQDDPKKTKIIAVSWALAYAYRTLLDTVGQQTEAGGQGDKAAKLDSEPKPADKPMAVATSTRCGKCTGKTNQPVDDDDDDDDAGEGPSAPPDVKSEVKAAGARSEANMESFSLKDLHGLRKDYTRRPDESIISWLVRLWDAAGEATILDGTEARHLGPCHMILLSTKE